MSEMIASLERLLAQGNDTAMLRLGLGKAHLDAGNAAEAAQHARRAVELQHDYSAAWKLLGKALAQAGEKEEARKAYTVGIEVAEGKGDLQAAKEMKVFLGRLQKN